jgi:hypothetical protein
MTVSLSWKESQYGGDFGSGDSLENGSIEIGDDDFPFNAPNGWEKWWN